MVNARTLKRSQTVEPGGHLRRDPSQRAAGSVSYARHGAHCFTNPRQVTRSVASAVSWNMDRSPAAHASAELPPGTSGRPQQARRALDRWNFWLLSRKTYLGMRRRTLVIIGAALAFAVVLIIGLAVGLTRRPR